MTISMYSSSSGRICVGSRPSIAASVGSAPGPTPNITRPRVRWSSSTMRSATHNGLWYGSDTTPVPSLMCWVRSAAAMMKISGDAMISLPAEWCSPIHASSKPSRSMCWISSRSYSSDSVGLCSGGWNGAMNVPNLMRIAEVPFGDVVSPGGHRRQRADRLRHRSAECPDAVWDELWEAHVC
jgi:hypothetical protein